MDSQQNNLVLPISEQEKITFLSVLVALGKIDNNFDETEKKAIIDSAVMFGIPKTKIPDILKDTPVDEIIASAAGITNRPLALSLIKEACLLANSDGDLSDDEVVFIGKLGEAMNIELEKVEQISRWVIDYLLLQEQEKIIFEKS